MKNSRKYVYAVCYLELKYFKDILSDLKSRGYKRITPIIPTINILKRVSKSHNYFEDVPILFNYGFIRMPIDQAYSRDFLLKLKNDIPGIRGWVSSPESLHPKKKRRRIDNIDIFDDFSIVATVSKEEVYRFKRLAKRDNKFSLDNLNMNIGDYIVLKGYPFDGVDATIQDINYRDRLVKLLLYPENGKMEISLPFDNVVYSVYNNLDENKLLVNSKNRDESRITSESILNVLDIKQY